MNYSSPAHQLYELLHYGFAFVLLMAVWPRFFVKADSDDPLANRFAVFSKAVCLYIIIVYLLVVLKLYEVISFSLVLLVMSSRRFWMKGSQPARAKTALLFNVRFYGFFEIGFQLKNKWKEARGLLTMPRKYVNLDRLRRGDTLMAILLFAVVGPSAYIRLYDAVHYAAPAMSDGAVTLAWMKYISARLMFEGDIYPQGYYITLSLLSKFAAIDPLYILKYTGPLNGVWTTIGYYFAISRMTGNKPAGLIGAAAFGIGGELWFQGDWERQAASNSQEFALVFLYPALLFFLRYLEKGGRFALSAGFAAISVAGFVHSLIFAYAGMGLGVLLIGAALTPSIRSWRRIGIVCAVGIVSAIMTYAPIQLGQWAGSSFNDSAKTYLVSTSVVEIPPLELKDKVGLVAIGIIVLSGVIGWRDKRRRLAEWFAAGIGIASFLLYYIVPTITSSTVIASRSPTLWALGICFSCGFAWWSLWRFFERIRGQLVLQKFTAGAVTVALAFYAHISPIIPYKMDWDSVFTQYLRIASMYRPQTFTIFSQEDGYSLLYGIGWHQYIRTLVTQYDPRGTPITRVGQDEYDPDVTKYMFVFEEKEIYKVPETMGIYEMLVQDRYTHREEDQKLLKEWLAEYTAAHGAPKIFYEDEHIRVWYLERPEAEDKEERRIWGNPDKS